MDLVFDRAKPAGEGGTRATILHEGLLGRESAVGHAGGFSRSLENLAAAMET